MQYNCHCGDLKTKSIKCDQKQQTPNIELQGLDVLTMHVHTQIQKHAYAFPHTCTLTFQKEEFAVRLCVASRIHQTDEHALFERWPRVK